MRSAQPLRLPLARTCAAGVSEAPSARLSADSTLRWPPPFFNACFAPRFAENGHLLQLDSLPALLHSQTIHCMAQRHSLTGRCIQLKLLLPYFPAYKSPIFNIFEEAKREGLLYARSKNTTFTYRIVYKFEVQKVGALIRQGLLHVGKYVDYLRETFLS